MVEVSVTLYEMTKEWAVKRIDALESENAGLRAEVERLRMLHRDAAHSLASATRLRIEARDAIDEGSYPAWWDKWRAFLAAQPEAPARTEAGSDPHGCVDGNACLYRGQPHRHMTRVERVRGEWVVPRNEHGDDTRTESCVHGQAGYCGACCLLDEPVPTKPTRTEAEQRVLDAMAAVPLETLQRSIANTLHAPEHSRAPCEAELARRQR